MSFPSFSYIFQFVADFFKYFRFQFISSSFTIRIYLIFSLFAIHLFAARFILCSFYKIVAIFALFFALILN